MLGLIRIVVLAASAAVQSGGQADSAIVGVLEDIETEEGDAHERRVRTMFRFNGGTWSAFPHRPNNQGDLQALHKLYPAAVNWTVCHGPKRLGQVTGRTPRRVENYGAVGLQIPLPKEKAPRVGEPSVRFAGDSDLPVLRPLVATNRRCAPAGYKAVEKPPEEVQERVIAALPSAEKKVSKNAYQWPATFQGPDGRWIVEVHRSQPRPRERRVAFVSAGKVVIADGEADSHIGLSSDLGPGTIVPQLIVDVGDWNNDGKTEVLTKFELENRDGYILLSEDGQALATFDWNYH